MSSDFRYLSEEDTIAAGVLDTAQCVETIAEVFRLLARGDYLMGGPSGNSHGLGLIFPKSSPFPNMPLAGPDRRFFAMPAYLGGRFDVCGNKWYGSNPENQAKGLPRSVLTLMLNDKDTGEPLTLMAANLVSAARTGAVPGAAVRVLARDDAATCVVIGCGPINKACLRAIASQADGLTRVVAYDLFEEKAKDFAAWCERELGVSSEACPDLEQAIEQGDLVSIAASRLAPLVVESRWFRPGSTTLVSGPVRADDRFWVDGRLVLDHAALHEAYVEEAAVAPDRQAYYDGVIGGQIYRLIDQGQLPALQGIADLGRVLEGAAAGRADQDERVVFVASGMPVLDVGWGYDVYQRALELGIGTQLSLWEKPHVD